MSDRYHGLTADDELDYLLLSQRDPDLVLDVRQIIMFSEQEVCDRFDWLVDNGYLTLVRRYAEVHGKTVMKNPTWELTRIGRHRLHELIEKRTDEPFNHSDEIRPAC